MPSSFGSAPRARPTSWGRWRTARPRSRLTTLAASGCCMSRLRWQRGQGVTRQSAPASIASPTWVPACRSEVSRFIVTTGKPQALRGPAVPDDLPADGLDPLPREDGAVGVVGVAEPFLRPHDVAAVEG